MSKQTLEALRARFSKDGNNEQKTGFTSNYYPFYNMKEGESCKVRFLPDANPDNPWGFLVTKVTHTLTINGEKKTVPCLSMYGEDCPICKVSQEYYKNKDEVNGKKYWKKKQHIAQVLVIDDPLPVSSPEERHEGKLRYISLGFQIFQIIQDAFKGDDLEGVPYDYEEGYDFIIKKTKQGEYSTYAIGTKFANRQRSLTEDELEVVHEGLVDLSTLLPKNPGTERIESMLQAALTGQSYGEDNEEEVTPPRRPAPAVKPAPAAKKPAPAVEDTEEEAPWEEPKAKVTKPTKVEKPTPVEEVAEETETEVNDMIARIRARRKAAAE